MSNHSTDLIGDALFKGISRKERYINAIRDYILDGNNYFVLNPYLCEKIHVEDDFKYTLSQIELNDMRVRDAEEFDNPVALVPFAKSTVPTLGLKTLNKIIRRDYLLKYSLANKLCEEIRDFKGSDNEFSDKYGFLIGDFFKCEIDFNNFNVYLNEQFDINEFKKYF